MATNSYSYAFKTLKEFNAFILTHNDIQSWFIHEDIQWLQLYQNHIFQDLKRGPDAKRVILSPTISEHIQRYILRLISYLAVVYIHLKKVPVSIYTVDRMGVESHDSRIGDVYTALKETRIPYVEIIHTVLGRQTWKHFLKRKRLAIYLKAAPHIHTHVPSCPDDATEIQRYLFSYVTSLHLRTLDILMFLKKLFKHTTIKTLFAIDDRRYDNVVIAASNSFGIKTISIQHGHITKFHVGWIYNQDIKGHVVLPSSYFLWSTYWKKEYLRLGGYVPENKLVVAGYQSQIQRTPISPSTDGVLRIVIPFETDAPFDEVRPYIEILAMHPHCALIIKTRTDTDLETQIVAYTLTDEVKKRIQFTSTLDAIPVDIVAGTYSTYLYDLAIRGVRVAIFKTSLEYAADMINNGLATYVTTDQLYEQMKRITLSEHTKVDSRLYEDKILKETIIDELHLLRV